MILAALQILTQDDVITIEWPTDHKEKKVKISSLTEILKTLVLSVVCLILIPYASADSPDEGIYNFANLNIGSLDSHQVLIMNGRGNFNSNRWKVDGEGEFTHFDNTGAPATIPFPIIKTGTWKAKSLVSWTPFHGVGPNPYGQVIAGILVMRIDLFPDGKGTPKRIRATLTVVCNVPPAGIFTGSPEGIELAIDGGVTFVPTNPITGVTFHTVGKKSKKSGKSKKDK